MIYTFAQITSAELLKLLDIGDAYICRTTDPFSFGLASSIREFTQTLPIAPCIIGARQVIRDGQVFRIDGETLYLWDGEELWLSEMIVGNDFG